MIDDSGPIFLQIAALIENDIVSGALKEEAQVPSTNEFAQYYRINPATAAKGVNTLVDSGLLYKKRGIGMFVSQGARAQVLERRRQHFATEYVHPLITEAEKLGINRSELLRMLESTLNEFTATPAQASSHGGTTAQTMEGPGR